MGAGSGGAGSGGAGVDPTTFTQDQKIKQLDPVLYDPAIRDTPRDPDTGLLKTIHWVDQAVALALFIPEGGVASDPKLGNRLRQIKRASGARLQSEVEDAVRMALDDLLTRGDITIVQIVTTTPARGQLIIVVTYVNQRLKPTKATPVQLAI